MDSESLTAQIECIDNSSIIFSHSQYSHVSSLEFIGCGCNQVKNVDKFVLQDIRFKGHKDSGTSLEIIDTAAQIINCTFTSYRRGKHIIIYPVYGYHTIRSVGSVIISNHSRINVSLSKFEKNSVNIGGAIIYAEEQSTISISDSIFISNIAGTGVICSTNSHITYSGKWI